MTPRHWNDAPGTERWSTRALRAEIAWKKRRNQAEWLLILSTLAGGLITLGVLAWIWR